MSDERSSDNVRDEELLASLGAALRADGVEADAADGPSAPRPSAALHARVLAAAEQEAFGGANKVAYLPRRTRAIPFAAAIASVAVAASFVLGMHMSSRDLSIPPYEAELVTADAEQRGAQDDTAGCASCGTLHLSGERFVLLVRPKVAPKGPVSAHAFLFRAGAPLPWAPPLDVGAGGVVRIAGQRSELLPPGSGELEVVVAVGSAEHLPVDATVARRAVTTPVPEFRAVSLRFTPSP